MKLSGNEFVNSDTCRGMSYASDGAPLDMAVIDISGRYPAEGTWAVNHECHEMVYVARGIGSLAIRDGGVTDLQSGDVVHVAPGQQFAWGGEMQIVMSCSPMFDVSQYEIIKSNEVTK